MNRASQNEGESLCREILANARTEAERLIRKARDDAGRLLATTTAEEEATRKQNLEKANREACHHKERILATLPVESQRLEATRMEALLQSIHDEVQRRLRAGEGFDPGETLMASAAYAINRMSGNTFIVTVAPADHVALGSAIAGEISRRTKNPDLQITVAENPTLQTGDIMIRDGEGRQEWDNRLTVRLERMWPALRLRLAEKGGPG